MAGSDSSVGVIDQTAAGSNNTTPVFVRQVLMDTGTGTYVTVDIQCVMLVDAKGRPVDFKEQTSLLAEIRDYLKNLNDRAELQDGVL